MAASRSTHCSPRAASPSSGGNAGPGTVVLRAWARSTAANSTWLTAFQNQACKLPRSHRLIIDVCRHRRRFDVSLTFSQLGKFVRRSPVASCLGSSLPGRKLSRLTPIPRPRDRHSVRISHGAVRMRVCALRPEAEGARGLSPGVLTVF